MIEELEHCTLSVISQTVYPSLLPMENIKKKIPYQTRVSLMTPAVRAYMSPQGEYIEFQLTEYHEAFNLIVLQTIPILLPGTKFYMTLNPPSSVHGINSKKEIFLYTPGLCKARHNYLICPPHSVKIKTVPTTCNDLLVLRTGDYANCQKSMVMSEVAQQSYIYRDAFTKVRIFSPYEDKLRTLCGSKFITETNKISLGYTDVITTARCIVYTSKFKIVSPIPPTDEETVDVKFEMPDISMAMDSLINDIETTYSINFTMLAQDFETFSKDIDIEGKTIEEVQKALETAKTLKPVQEFSLTKIDMKAIHQPSEQLKIGFYVVSIAILVLFMSCCYFCCPLCFTSIIKGIFSMIWNLFEFIFKLAVTAFRTLQTKFQNCRSRQQDDTTSTNTEGSAMWSDNTLQLRPSLRNRNNTPRNSILIRSRRNSEVNPLDDSMELFSPSANSTPNPYSPPPLSPAPARSAPPPPYMTNMYPSSHDLSMDTSDQMPNAPTDIFNFSILNTPTSDYEWCISNPSYDRCILRCQILGKRIYYIPNILELRYEDGTTASARWPPQKTVTEYISMHTNLRAYSLEEFRQRYGVYWHLDTELHAFYKIVSDKRQYHFGYKADK
jgi:hypothetical protein